MLKSHGIAIPAPSKPNTLSVEEVGKLGDRIVYIEILDSNYKPLGSGSGIVTNDGVLTNYHVAKDAVHLKIEFTNGESYISDELLLKDADRDLALIKPSGSYTPPIAIFGDSSKITLGQQIVAVGSPLGYKNSLTTGVVSSTNRVISNYPFIQLSAPVDHGSSGGALFNMSGEVIGVVSAGVNSQAEINLAIPSSDVISFLARTKQPESLGKLSLLNVELENYLNSNYSSRTYKNNVYHFTYNVITPTDNTGYNIAVSLTDMSEYFKYASAQLIDDAVYPALIYVSYYPTAFPQVSISPQGTGYRTLYCLVYGKINYNDKVFSYTLYPDESYKKSVNLPWDY